MRESYVDLHCHSTASDGTLTPTEVVRLARRQGLSALSLTDHDTMAGVKEAAAEAAVLGLDFLPGIEISAAYPRPGTLHILGYGVNPADKSLDKLLAKLLASRAERNPRMVQRLNEMGIMVTMDDWRAEAGGGVLGRPQLAAILVREGHATTRRDAFDRFIGESAPAYFDKERLSAAEALAAIRAAGGVPVLAHPNQLRCGDQAQLEQVVRQLMAEGLGGIEVIHSDLDDAMVGMLCDMADRLGLLKSGGSDFHGDNKPGIALGWARNRRIPREFYESLRSARAQA